MSASTGAHDLMEHWLSHVTAIRGQSDKTIDAYRRDVSGYLGFLTNYKGCSLGKSALAAITITDMRAWMAHERRRGIVARSLARSLSAVKSFYRWLSETHGLEVTSVLATRAPKFKVGLPHPVASNDAKKNDQNRKPSICRSLGQCQRYGRVNLTIRLRFAYFRSS